MKRKQKKSIRYRIASLVRLIGDVSRPRTAAVILAGGSGTRFGGDRPKQLSLLCGIPVLIRSALAFEDSPYIDEIVIVSREQDVEEIREICAGYSLRKLRKIVVGGATRQESSLFGVSAVSEEMEFVAIHDAARCLVTPNTINRVAAEAYVYGGASAASQVVDTIKQVDAMGFLKRTIDRDSLVAAETPQIFRKKLYLAAAYAARENTSALTDDNSLLERMGQAVKSVLSLDENFKITTKADLLRAEAVIGKREGMKEGDR